GWPSVAKILPRTRKSGWPMCADSVACGRLKARRRNPAAVIVALVYRFRTDRARGLKLALVLGTADSGGRLSRCGTGRKHIERLFIRRRAAFPTCECQECDAEWDRHQSEHNER